MFRGRVLSLCLGYALACGPTKSGSPPRQQDFGGNEPSQAPPPDIGSSATTSASARGSVRVGATLVTTTQAGAQELCVLCAPDTTAGRPRLLVFAAASPAAPVKSTLADLDAIAGFYRDNGLDAGGWALGAAEVTGSPRDIDPRRRHISFAAMSLDDLHRWFGVEDLGLIVAVTDKTDQVTFVTRDPADLVQVDRAIAAQVSAASPPPGDTAETASAH